MLDVLENKVSELIAENGNLKVKNIQMIKDTKDLEDELAAQKLEISKLIATLETQAKENNHLQHILKKSDDSKISVYQYESVKTDLLSSQSQNAALKTQLAITVAEKDSLFSNLLDIKNSLVFVMAILDKKYQNTEYVVNQKMSALEDKVMRV